MANDLAAVGADSRALVANRRIAMAAVVGILFIHHVATVVTGDTLPVAERDIRAVWVVGGQDPSHHHEEIAESAFFQGCPYGGCTVSLAERFIAHMRVCDRLILCGRMGIDGHDAIGISAV